MVLVLAGGHSLVVIPEMNEEVCEIKPFGGGGVAVQDVA